MNHHLYEVQLANAEGQHEEPVFVEFFSLQIAKLRILELCNNFSDKVCKINKLKEMGLDTDSLYLAHAEKELTDRILSGMEDEWQTLRSHDCDDSLTADKTRKFFPSNLLCKTQET